MHPSARLTPTSTPTDNLAPERQKPKEHAILSCRRQGFAELRMFGDESQEALMVDTLRVLGFADP